MAKRLSKSAGSPRESQVIQKRKRISVDEATRITVARYSTSPPRRLKELSDEFNRSEVVISRTIGKALREGLVEVVAPRNRVVMSRRSDVEKEVLERYSELNGCVVLESGHVTTPEDHDRLHRQLGHAMANVIGAGSFFRDGDIIGLGSGRGVYYTIQGLNSYGPLRARVTLLSLTGDVYARDHSEQLNLLLDANIHLGLLGPRFSKPATLRPMSGPICMNLRLPAKLRNPDETIDEKVTHALLGLGVLAPGHRFYKEVKARPESRTTFLKPIQQYLEHLVDVSDAVAAETKQLYWPVADIANRLFFVPPPAQLQLSSKMLSRMEGLDSPIKEINARLVAISDSALRAVPYIVVVAGSQHKGIALRHLMKSGYPIRHLCIDQAAAEELLSSEGS